MNGATVLLTLLAYAGLLCVGAIVETLGVPPAVVMAIAAVPVGLSALALALAGATMDERAYLAGSRPMSAFSGGAWLAIHALAGAVLVALAGGDAGAPPLALPLAALAGIVLAAAIPGPAIRAAGAATLAGFLARRFGSRLVRVLGAALVMAICLPLAALLMQASAAGLATLFGGGRWSFAFVFVAVVLVALPGGVKGLAAGHRLVSLLLLFACVVPAAWLLAMQEAAPAWPPDYESGDGLLPADAQGLIRLLCVAIAVAALPTLLAGFAAMGGGSRFLRRRLTGWGLLLVLVPLAAAAVLGIAPAAVPGLLAGEAAAPGFEHLPLAARVLAATAGLIAAMLVAAGLLLSAANALGHDICHRTLDPMAPTSRRLVVSRLLLIVLAASAAYAATNRPDAVAAASIWSLSLAAAGLFPVLALGIWWRGATAAGAAAGLLAGAAVTSACLVASRYGLDLQPGSGDEWTLWLGLDGIAVAAFGLPAAMAAMAGISLLGRRTARPAAEDA